MYWPRSEKRARRYVARAVSNFSTSHSSATEPKSHKDRATEPQSSCSGSKIKVISSAVNTQPSAVDVKGPPLRRRACADFLDLMSDLYPSIAQCAVAAAALKFLLFPA